MVRLLCLCAHHLYPKDTCAALSSTTEAQTTASTTSMPATAFWNLAGGYGARIVVLTTNADVSQADYGYAAAFQALEAARVRLLGAG